jgi:putative transposase
MSDSPDGQQDLPNEAFEPARQRVDIQAGGLVQRGNSVFRITEVLDFDSVIAMELETGRSSPLRINELRPVVGDTGSVTDDIAEIADEDWKIAQQRFAAIKPLLSIAVMGRNDVMQRAKEVGVDTATLYRWLQKYNAIGVVTALIPQKRGWKEGKGRIPAFAEKVIDEVINDFYLTTQRSTPQKTVTEVLRRCQQRGIEAPHPSTIPAASAAMFARLE